MTHDLLYLNTDDNSGELYHETWQGIRESFPEAKIEDGSDWLHPHRLVVEVEVETEAWYRWLLGAGVALCSFHFQLDLQAGEGLARRLAKEFIAERNGSADGQSNA